MPRHHAPKYLGDFDHSKWPACEHNFEYSRDCVISRNEDLSGPNLDEHSENCTCWRCEFNETDSQREAIE